VKVEKMSKSADEVVFQVQGDLTLSTARDFIDPILEEISQGKARVVSVNLSGVEHIDSFGLGFILRCHNTMTVQRNFGGEVRFLINDFLLQKFRNIGLDKVVHFRLNSFPHQTPRAC
jgi:anti-anti-sigma factor